MNWIQALLIVSMLALLLYLLRSRGTARAGVGEGRLRLFVFAAVYAMLRPDDTTVVANWFGVNRGTDLMPYAMIMAFVFTTLSTYMRFKDLELRYTRSPARSRCRMPGCSRSVRRSGSTRPSGRRRLRASRAVANPKLLREADVEA